MARLLFLLFIVEEEEPFYEVVNPCFCQSAMQSDLVFYVTEEGFQRIDRFRNTRMINVLNRLGWALFK